MKLRNLSQIVALTVLALSVTACGGGSSTAQKAANTVAGAAGSMAGGAQSEAQREAAALPVGQMAPVNINCGAVKPVWVNLNTKAYHEPGDPYYGRTKHGQYMCPSQAAAQGYHPAGERHKGAKNAYGGGNYSSGSGAAQGGAYSNPAGGAAGAGAAAGAAGGAAAGAAGSMYPRERRHHRRHRGEEPNPTATP